MNLLIGAVNSFGANICQDLANVSANRSFNTRMPMDQLARLLILFGAIVILAGLALLVIGRVPFLGRLPGDLTIQTGGLTCFFPLATSIILSILLTILLNIVVQLFHK